MAKTERQSKEPSARENPQRQAFEHWAAELETPAWLLAATKTKHGWPQGRLLTRSEFDKALKATEGEVIR